MICAGRKAGEFLEKSIKEAQGQLLDCESRLKEEKGTVRKF
jgi:hypothetical protein